MSRFLEDRPGELKVRMWCVRRHVMLQSGLVLDPVAEGEVAGAGDVQRARAHKDHGGLRIPEADLRPAQRLRQSTAGAAGAAIVFRHRTAV